jgi:hypothetical protein
VHHGLHGGSFCSFPMVRIVVAEFETVAAAVV